MHARTPALLLQIIISCVNSGLDLRLLVQKLQDFAADCRCAGAGDELHSRDQVCSLGLACSSFPCSWSQGVVGVSTCHAREVPCP